METKVNFLKLKYLQKYLDEMKKRYTFVRKPQQNGLLGMGWCIEYLQQRNLVSGAGNEVLDEVDKRVACINIGYLYDYSFSTGREGILLYVLCRLKGSILRKEPFPFNQSFLSDIQEVIINDLQERRILNIAAILELLKILTPHSVQELEIIPCSFKDFNPQVIDEHLDPILIQLEELI